MTRLQEARQAFIDADPACYLIGKYYLSDEWYLSRVWRMQAYTAWLAAVREFRSGR